MGFEWPTDFARTPDEDWTNGSVEELARKYDTVEALGFPAGAIQRAITFGDSQAGRLLRHFLYDGFNVDEQERKAFDGLIPHLASNATGSFNHRH